MKEIGPEDTPAAPHTHLGSTNVIVGPNYRELALFKVISVGTVRSDEVLTPASNVTMANHLLLPH